MEQPELLSFLTDVVVPVLVLLLIVTRLWTFHTTVVNRAFDRLDERIKWHEEHYDRFFQSGVGFEVSGLPSPLPRPLVPPPNGARNIWADDPQYEGSDNG